MSYSSCYILILAVTVAGHDLQINILLNVLFTEKLKNSVIIDILDCQKTGSWIRNFCAKKYHLTMMKLTIGLPIHSAWFHLFSRQKRISWERLEIFSWSQRLLSQWYKIFIFLLRLDSSRKPLNWDKNFISVLGLPRAIQLKQKNVPRIKFRQ